MDNNVEVLDGNKLIAEFMDFDLQESEKYKDGKAQYHSSWDWLMPVVDKIESMGYNVCTNERTCCINDTDGYFKDDDFFAWVGMETIAIESKSKIEATWKAVVQFVKWYKTQSK